MKIRIQINYSRLMQLADSKGIHKLSELCYNSGTDYDYVRSAICKRRTVNTETYYLLAKYLNCHMEEIMLLKDNIF